ALESVGPQVHSALGVKQLSPNSYPVTAFADRTVEHITNAQFPADPLHIDHLALVGKGRAPGDYEQPAYARKSGDDLFYHSVGKVLLFGVFADVGKWKHRDRRLLRQRRAHRIRLGGQFPGKTPPPRFPDVSNKSEPFPRQGSDQTLVLAVIADCPPRRIDARGHGRIRDDPSAPD